jgi:RNA polymerase sigma-70 factor (ECF subfamily)
MEEFDGIYREFQPRIHRYLGQLCGEADASDLTQTVFLKVSQSLAGFRGDSSLATWIYRIAANTARDHALSPLARQRKEESLFDDDGSVDDLPDEDALGTEREYLRQEMNDCIRGVLDQLPETYRTVLLLSDFEELTNAEIAGVLGVSVDAVKIRLHRGRSALRRAMECRCSLYHDERNELMCDRKVAG